MWSSRARADGDGRRARHLHRLRDRALLGSGGASRCSCCEDEQPDAPRPFRAWGYPIAPAIYAIASLAILVNGLYRAPGQPARASLIIAAGIPVYCGLSAATNRKSQIPDPKSQGQLIWTWVLGCGIWDFLSRPQVARGK